MRRSDRLSLNPLRVAALAGLASAPVTLDHFLLYESHLGSAGASYEAVARFPLG